MDKPSDGLFGGPTCNKEGLSSDRYRRTQLLRRAIPYVPAIPRSLSSYARKHDVYPCAHARSLTSRLNTRFVIFRERERMYEIHLGMRIFVQPPSLTSFSIN